MLSPPALTAQYVLQAAERYFAQTETYEHLSIQKFADFLGIAWGTVYKLLPASQWKQLQRTWVRSRIEQAIATILADRQTREDLTLEKFAHDAKIPLAVLPASFSENEWQAIKAHFPATVVGERCTVQEPSSGSTDYILQAEKYLAATERHEEITFCHFAQFVGVPPSTLRKRFPAYQWEQVRDTWIENRVKQAMDAAFAESQTQNDFTLKKIAGYAAMSQEKVMHFLPESAFEDLRARLPTMQTYLESQAEIYLAQTKDYKNISREHFARFLGVPRRTLAQQFFGWETLRMKWVKDRIEEAMDVLCAKAKSMREFSLESISRYAGIPSSFMHDHLSEEQWQTYHKTFLSALSNRVRHAMDQVYKASKTQEDFSLVAIAKLAGILQETIPVLIGDEWQIRRATLPTMREKMLAALQSLVDAHIPVSELTRRRVAEVANVNCLGAGSWFDQPLQVARSQLTQQQKQATKSPSGMKVGAIPDHWIALEDNIWDLRPVGGSVLRKEDLRKDTADIVWCILREEIRNSSEIAMRTFCGYYQGFLNVGALLGDEIPDIRRSTLKAIEQAWVKFEGTKAQRVNIRPRLVQLFTRLAHLGKHDSTIDGEEMFRIAAWLNTITIGRTKLGEEFLSESELDAVIHGCLSDIAAGIAYTETHHDLLTVNLHPLARDKANVLVHWAVALMTLLMAFTGLRRESLLELKINDWAEIRQGLYILAWRHNKKVEENVAVLPAVLAQQLQLYVQCTAQVRVAFGIESVFLTNDLRGVWKQMPLFQCNERLQEFVERHHIERDGLPITLNSTVLRRTYTTRALYEGRNIVALRSQLGHMYLDTTIRYVKFDQYEHPAEVGPALDEYGRKALVLWHTPFILDELESDKRASLLSVKEKQQQDVGICCQSHCVKALQGSPPPCSLCEHLVTGPEFFSAWEAEHERRTQDLRRLAEEPGSEMTLAQMKYQFGHFEANFAFIQERFRR